MTLTLLMSTGQVIGSVFLSRGLSNVASHLDSSCAFR